MEHCLIAENGACRTRADCKTEDLCVLSGYSDDVRGNDSLTAICSSDMAVPKHSLPEYPPEAYVPKPSPGKRLTDAVLLGAN